MSMSVHFKGIKPPDTTFEKMYKIYALCQESGIAAPKKVIDFFDGEDPDAAGVVIDLEKRAVKATSNEDRESWDVDLSKVPEDVKFIRFVISY